MLFGNRPDVPRLQEFDQLKGLVLSAGLRARGESGTGKLTVRKPLTGERTDFAHAAVLGRRIDPISLEVVASSSAIPESEKEMYVTSGDSVTEPIGNTLVEKLTKLKVAATIHVAGDKIDRMELRYAPPDEINGPQGGIIVKDHNSRRTVHYRHSQEPQVSLWDEAAQLLAGQ